ncbi:Protein of uncharacterised function (DUF1071) [[Pasteurella] mairii]|uniref:Protein of uncharacterized function (DUF1071) n=1 Tax=[Pasteurella] mairii TaxID=757 RepID=A0A379B1S2_9PAST|nr:Protein of uncharacterised function (DUF1071) [[Pasteurella] mairii]
MNEITSFQGEVWKILSTIDPKGKIEKKKIPYKDKFGNEKYMELSYLSWAWAWGILMEYFPESSYVIHEDRYLPNNTVISSVTITIKKGEQEFSRYMWLPVMDNKNKAIANPDAMAINKTYMRCLAKAIAMCGLGHYIYAGEDVPNTDIDDEQKQNNPPKTVSQNHSKPTTPPSTNSTPADKFKGIINERLNQCKTKEELTALYDKLEAWVTEKHPEYLDEFSLNF